MEIYTSSHFERRYKKLPELIKEKAKKHEETFRANPFDPRLDTHKLHGKGGEWAFSVDYEYRTKFIFLEGDNKALFLDIGIHGELYR